MDVAEVVLMAMAGMALAATAGFRVFVPLLVAGLAVRSGHLTVAADMAWIGTTPALVTFGVATAMEAAAVQIPWLDNLLDVLAGPAAVIAGAVLAAGFLVDVSPWLRWTLGAVSGGAVAGVIHASLATVRVATTTVTGGLANPLLALLETATAAITAVLAVFAPVLAVIGLMGLGWLGWRALRRLRGGPPVPEPT